MTTALLILLAAPPSDPPDPFVRPLTIGNARVRVLEESQVAADTPGTVLQYDVREGDVVRKGQVLARLNDAVAGYEADSRREAAENRAGADAAKHRTDLAKIEYQMARTLYEKRSGAMLEMNQKQTQVQVAEAEARNESAKLRQAAAEWDKAKQVLKQHRIVSPFDGVVQQRIKQVGEGVQAYEAIVHVVRVDRVRIEGEVDARYAHRLKPGQKVVVHPNVIEGELATLWHLSSVHAVRLLPDGERCVAACEDGSLVVWNLAGGLRERVIAASDKPVRCLALVPKSPRSIAAAGDDGRIRIWNWTDGSLQQTLSLPESDPDSRVGVHAVAFDPADPDLLAAGGHNGRLRLWNVRTGELVRSWDGHINRVGWLGFAGRDRRIVSAGDDGFVRLWDPEGRAAGAHAGLSTSAARPIRQLGFSTSGDLMAFPSQSLVWLRRLSDGSPAAEWEGGPKAFSSVAVFLGDDMVLAASEDSQLLLWQRGTSPRLARVFDGHNRAGAVAAVDASPGGRFFVSAGGDRTVRVWPLPTRERLVRERCEAKLTFVSPQLDRGSDRVVFHAEADNASGLLRANAGATVTTP